MVRGTISTYRLRRDLLEAYLQKAFPGYTAFNVQLSEDSKGIYTFDTPSALTEEQKNEIEDVRLKHDEDVGFL